MLKNNKGVIAGSVVYITTLTACGGGSSASVDPVITTSTTTSASTTSTAVVNDDRHHFDTFSIQHYPNVVGYSDTVTQTYAVTDHKTSGLPKDTDNFSIKDYGFFQSEVSGTQPGFEYGEESQFDGAFWQGSEVFRAEINGDGFEDFFVTINVGHDKNEFKPGDYVFAFLNDGYGHFILSNHIFPDGIPCLRGSAEHCNDSEHVKGTVIADFNGDGQDDFYQGTTLLLSDNGYFYDKRDTNLPLDLYESFASGEHNGLGFTHDAYAADIDGDNDVDIFIPFASPMKDNSVPKWAVLVNDGSGNFSANTNFPEQARKMFATASAIGDFNNDGHGDIALGWFSANDVNQSAGIILWNDGSGNWHTSDWTELPAGVYGNNNNVNDIRPTDFNNDGLLDLVVASTKHEPYYDGRFIQFFANNGDQTFIDVTNNVSPGNDKYIDGLNNGYWNGDGPMSILDFDSDGDLDIVDSVWGSYVLINNGGEFKLYDDFPRFDQNSALYPVNINGTFTYDFIGYKESGDATTSALTYFHVVDLF